MKFLGLTFFRALFGATIICCATAHAATFTVVPLDGTSFQKPDGLVFDQLTGVYGTNAERDIRDARNNAQTFTLPADLIIDQIVIYFEEAPLSSSTTTFEFFSTTDPLASNLNSITLLDSVTFSSSDLGVAAGTLIFDVANTSVVAGLSYGIRFTTAAGAPVVFKWKFSATNFDDGTRYEKNAAQEVDDFTVGVIAIPEPSAFALLAGCSLLAFAAGRRRSRK